MNKEAIGTLTGKFFKSVNDDKKPNFQTMHWNGQFLGLVSPGVYRVQLFDDPEKQQKTEQRLIPAVDMRYWLIFETADELKQHVQREVAEIRRLLNDQQKYLDKLKAAKTPQAEVRR